MTGENDSMKMAGGERMAHRLRHLMHLKDYEKPDTARMTKNKHNIMRRVRTAKNNQRRSVAEWIEGNLPWFFAEPRYGIAVLFVVFAGLQYWGVSSQRQASGKMGIYTSGSEIAAYSPDASYATNRVAYPQVPDNFQLFPEQQGGSDVKFVGRRDVGK